MKLLLTILPLFIVSTAVSMQPFVLRGHGDSEQKLALNVAQAIPYLQPLVKNGMYTLMLPDASKKDLSCLATYLLKRSANCISSNHGNASIDPWVTCDTEKNMDVNDIKKLIKHATLLLNKDEIAPIGLLETWRKKVEENNLWDNESACSIDFISEKDGIPLLDYVWCKKFLLTKDKVLVACKNRLFGYSWNNDEKKFKFPSILQEFNSEMILRVQMDPEKTQLFISTIKKTNENSFLCNQYQYDLNKEKVIKEWKSNSSMDQKTYKRNYLESCLSFNMHQIKYDFDQKNTPSAWLLSKIVTYGAAAIIVAIILGLGLKAYSKK